MPLDLTIIVDDSRDRIEKDNSLGHKCTQAWHLLGECLSISLSI